MTWFKKITGFSEDNPNSVYSNLDLQGNVIKSISSGREMICGTLEIPTLAELRERNILRKDGELVNIKVTEIIGNVQEMHADTKNKNALFQAASQFNLLEMTSPRVTPEMGVSIYEHDNTQGPACAIACGAGTIYRNYFADVNGKVGQTENNQIDCLKEIGQFFENHKTNLWTMQNGYAMIEEDGFLQVDKKLASLSDKEYQDLQGKLKVGIQWDTEVTYRDAGHLVSQVYCSALPIGYCKVESYYAERFAALILSATYEATMYAALENYHKTGCNIVYLTLVGGGVFANRMEWIQEAIITALEKFKTQPLDVRIVSYGSSKPEVLQICSQFV